MNEKEQYTIIGFIVLVVLAIVGGGFLLMKNAPTAPVETADAIPPNLPETTVVERPADMLYTAPAIAATDPALAAIPNHLRPGYATTGGTTASTSPAATGTTAATGNTIPTATPGTPGTPGTANTETGDDPSADSTATGAEPKPHGIAPLDKAAFIAEIIDGQAMLTPEQKEQAAEVIKELEAIFDKYLPQVENDYQAQMAAYAEAYALKFNPEQAAALELEWLQYRAKLMQPYLQERILAVQELLPMLDAEQRRVFDGNLQTLFVQQAQFRNAVAGKLTR